MDHFTALCFSEQCGSLGKSLYDLSVTDGSYQLAVPVLFCYKLVTSVLCHDVVHLEQCAFLYDVYVKFISARKCQQRCQQIYLMKEIAAGKQFTIW
jgi:hypothetical protein